MLEPKLVTHEIAQSYLTDQNVDDQLRNAISGHIRAQDLAWLSTCSTIYDPHMHGVREWRVLRQIEAFYKKNAVFADRSLLAEGARIAFQQCEVECSGANVRVTDLALGNLERGQLRQDLYSARAYIKRVLGSYRSFAEQLACLVRVTSGASVNAPRSRSLPQLKLSLKPYCSSKAVELVKGVYRSFGFENVRPRQCDSNRIELVPKDWRKDRTIACEPEGSLPLQLAFDTWAKRRLRRFGIDLSDQSRNQRLCHSASVSDRFVTVDFSSASDTISYCTVAWLFPPAWFEYLDSIRSPNYRGAFGAGHYEKFSSMGNGSTFCIETLIFSSLCFASGSRSFLVYGDDVIIEEEYYDRFAALAEFLGFTVNVAKTFRNSPIRESCGKEYFKGEDVTPVTIKNIDSRKANLCHLVNSLGALTYPGEHLRETLDRIISDASLPFVPYNQSTLSGVWIDPRLARKLGLLRVRRNHENGPTLPMYKSFVAEMTQRVFVDSRGYYLWFLHKTGQLSYAGPWDSSIPKEASQQTSSAPVFAHSYKRKWVVWQPPDAGVPDTVFIYSIGKHVVGE